MTERRPLTDDELISRWKANAAAGGVRLTEVDIERAASRGSLDALRAIDEIITRVNAAGVSPDYLRDSGPEESSDG